MKKFWNFIKDEDGLELSEYAIMGALIAVALIGAVVYLSGAIDAKFTEMANTITTGAAPAPAPAP